MASHRLENYLKACRKKTGLTQREVAFLLGWKTGEQFSRYEKRHRLPPLQTALACEVVFGIPVSELFAGVSESVKRDIAARIDTLGAELERESGGGRRTRLALRKLSWLSEQHGRALTSKT